MRTTIELSDEQRARLLELAARRGEKGFSHLVQEALDLYLALDAPVALPPSAELAAVPGELREATGSAFPAPELPLDLGRLALRSGKSVASLVREAVAEYLERASTEGGSLFDLAPHASGRLLAAWTRDELFDEMIGA